MEVKPELALIIILKIAYTLGFNVAGRTLSHALIPMNPHFGSIIQQRVPVAQLSRTPDLPKIILRKNLLELNCLRNGYNRHRLNRPYKISGNPTGNYFINEPHIKYPYRNSGSNGYTVQLGNGQNRNQVKNKNIKRRRYGENDKLLLTAIREQMPKVTHSGLPLKKVNFPIGKHPQVENKDDKITKKPTVYEEIGISKASGNKTREMLSTTSTPPQTLLHQNESKKGENKILVTFPMNKDVENINERDQNKPSTEAPKNTIAIDAPIIRPQDIVKKPARIPLFPMKRKPLPMLFNKNSTKQSWPSVRPSTFRPYEVEEIVEENVRVDADESKDGNVFNKGNFNKQKFQEGLTPAGITYNLPVNYQTKPIPEESLGLLKSSLNKILKGLIGSDSKEINERLGRRKGDAIDMSEASSFESDQNQFTDRMTSPLPSASVLNSHPLPKGREYKEIPKSSSLSNSEYAKDNHQRKEDKELLHTSLLPTTNHQSTTSITKRSTEFTPNNSTISSYTTSTVSKFYNHTQGAILLNDSIPRSINSTSEPPTTLTSISGAPQVSNVLNPLFSTATLPDLLTYSFDQEAEDDKVRKMHPTPSSNYYVQTEEMRLMTSSEGIPSESSTDLVKPTSWLQNERQPLSSPATHNPNWNFLLQEFFTSSLQDLPSTEPELMHIVTILPEETESSTSIEKDKEFSMSEITMPFKEFTDNPLTFDLLATTIKTDSKNQDSSLKNGRKMHFDENLERTEFFNSLPDQRRSDILINDDVYEKNQNEVASTGYIQKLKQNSSSDFSIDTVLSVLPSIIDDLRRNRIQPNDLSFMSETFGKYWPFILTLAKQPNLDMLPFLQLKEEKDLQKVLLTFLPHEFAPTTEESDLDAEDSSDGSFPPYDYTDEYKDLYDQVVEQNLHKREINKGDYKVFETENEQYSAERDNFSGFKRQAEEEYQKLKGEAVKEW